MYDIKNVCSDASSEPIALESHITELTELKEQVLCKVTYSLRLMFNNFVIKANVWVRIIV